MLDAAAVFAAYVAAALFHASDPARLPVSFPIAARPAWKPVLRIAGLALCVLAAVLWMRAENPTAGLIAAFVAVMAAESVFTILAPIAPRTLYGIAVAAPVLIASFAVAGGAFGR
jgi:hypothetical protein